MLDIEYVEFWCKLLVLIEDVLVDNNILIDILDELLNEDWVLNLSRSKIIVDWFDIEKRGNEDVYIILCL